MEILRQEKTNLLAKSFSAQIQNILVEQSLTLGATSIRCLASPGVLSSCSGCSHVSVVFATVAGSS